MQVKNRPNVLINTGVYGKEMSPKLEPSRLYYAGMGIHVAISRGLHSFKEMAMRKVTGYTRSE